MITNDQLEQLLRQTLGRQADQIPSTSSEDAARSLQEVKRHQFLGRWEGEWQHSLTQGMRISLPSEPGTHIVIPHNMTVRIAMRLTLESARDAQLSGDGEIAFDFRALGERVTKSVYPVYVDITGKVKEDDRITLALHNIEDSTHKLKISATLVDHGRALKGTYEARGLLTEEKVWGEFTLVKVQELPGDYELIIFEPKRKLIDLLEQARRSILVTHFTTEIPSDEYISTMIRKLKEEVSVERIVAQLPDAPQAAYNWLDRFKDKRRGTARRNYTEYRFAGTPLPADIMVVDEKVALQYFATYPDPGRFSFAVCHYDPLVARRFHAYIKALMPDQITPRPRSVYI